MKMKKKILIGVKKINRLMESFLLIFKIVINIYSFLKLRK